MTSPPSIDLSQTSLSAYLACPRRFLLRHVAGEAWPATQTEPAAHHERMRELGIRFHKLVGGHLSGFPEKDLARMAAEEPVLRGWWSRYLAFPVPDLPADRRTEVSLSMPIGNRRLLAKYDLLAMDPDRAVIVDWKTERRRPAREDLLARLQTRVYRYLLVEAAQALTGAPLSPDRILMIYWFAEDPEHPERLPYHAAQHAEDGRFLLDLVRRIESDEVFPMTADASRCRLCGFRSLCDRGVVPEECDDDEFGEEADGGPEIPDEEG